MIGIGRRKGSSGLLLTQMMKLGFLRNLEKKLRMKESLLLMSFPVEMVGATFILYNIVVWANTIKKHGYNKIIPKEMEGRPIISVVGNNKGKPFVLAHELGHASPGNLDKNPNGKFGFRAKAEELRANIKGYQMLKKSGANKDTLKKARKGFYQQTLGTLLAGHTD